MDENLVWIDLEMTGLNVKKQVIIEIATLITDNRLQPVAEGPVIAIHYPEEVFSSMEAWSREQHEASGLMARVRASRYSCRRAEAETIRFISAYCQKGQSPLCGNSVWQDRIFLTHHMPELENYLHYRIIDVSTIKELARRWFPELPRFKKNKTHLASDDIRESIEELRFYRKQVFKVDHPI